MIQLKWEHQTTRDFAELVGLVPDPVLASPSRSTVPLLDLCRQPARFVADLEGVAGYALQPPVELIFEYQLNVQKGRGKPSCTDLMALGSDASIAIEAKYTEPAYESVSKWLSAARDDNRGQVLEGWLGVLGNAAERTIEAAEVADLPYQLIHRCASAAFVDRPKKTLLYLVFGSDVAAHYQADLARMAELLGTQADLPLLLVGCAAAPTTAMEELTARWSAGERNLGKDVREALLRGPLFTFGALEVLYRSVGGGLSPST